MKNIYILIPVFIIYSGGRLQAAKINTRLGTTVKQQISIPKEFGPGDPHISYYGRWNQEDPSRYTSFWGGAYFKVKFTGRTVKIKLSHKSNYYVKIDEGPWTSYTNVNGTVDLTPIPLQEGTHTLCVAQGKDYDYEFDFLGLILDPGSVLRKPDKSKRLIEWIGDSITSGYTDPQAEVSDYAWVCSEMLEAEHTQIAYPGINLVSGYHGQGMDVQYLKQRSLKFPESSPWNFTRYHPDIIVINLGTNDVNNHVPPAVFKTDYENFLRDLRKKFPNTEVFVMRTFSGAMAAETEDAVKAINMGGDTKLHFINTQGWLKKGTTDFTDGTHPSVSGHIKVANLLNPLLAPYIAYHHSSQ